MTRMTRYEMKALMLERQVAMEESDVPLYPTMERVFSDCLCCEPIWPRLRH
jgi:hypothetical protein